ncbi:MAG: hypothetical protein KJO60_03910 [Desulfofustis sp.]|nr:hypothetical protein [Desulfofustis sp.]NNK56276.1 hypothetical protein [Desulfofustis sp.]
MIYTDMIEIEKLRKADIFSGTAIFCLGVFAVYQAFQMPMKDSYAGVQNVWYVSPALFPLLIGSTLALLGLILIRTALKEVGVQGVKAVFGYLSSTAFADFLKQPVTIRFYGIVLNLFIFVFLLIPNIDFFLAAILFLLLFFFMFYCGFDERLVGLISKIIGGTFILALYLISDLADKVDTFAYFSADILVIAYIFLLIWHYYQLVKESELIPKFKLSLLIGFLAPFTIGIIFKYFLLVPMPHEGLVVSLLDAIWYAEIWS